MPDIEPLERHHDAEGFSDRIAYAFTRFLRFFADTFFAKRYGHRAVVLETVTAVPGMVAGNQGNQGVRELETISSFRMWLLMLVLHKITRYFLSNLRSSILRTQCLNTFSEPGYA